jgi:hypothetical protein
MNADKIKGFWGTPDYWFYPPLSAVSCGQMLSRLASIFRCLSSSPFKGEVRRGMGVVLATMLPHPHPNPPLEGEGGFFSGRSALIGNAFDFSKGNLTYE